jgi:glycosyltransferase EpsE
MAQAVPLITVVMTTYRDDPPVLKRAIDSILGQTWRDLEFVVVFEPDDPNWDMVNRDFRDPRIVLVRCMTKTGMAGSFNEGLSRARGRYIARMDSDDVAYPHRLETQVRHLQAHPDLAVLGAAGRLMDRDGNMVGVRQFPTTHGAIVRHFTLTNPVFHPTVMWDRERVGYGLRYDASQIQEDTELWLRLLRGGHRFANLPDALIDYTQPDGYRRPKKVWKGGIRARLKHWRLGLQNPMFFVGIALRFGLLVLPVPLLDAITQRNGLSDRLRSIRRDAPLSAAK